MQMGSSFTFNPYLCFLQELALLPAEVFAFVLWNLLESCCSICYCLHSCRLGFLFGAMPGKPHSLSIMSFPKSIVTLVLVYLALVVVLDMY